MGRGRWDSFTFGGAAVAAGGALTIGLNVGLTPFLQASASFAETAASPLFVWRQSLSALVALLLLAGSVALHRGHADRAGPFGALAFLLAFAGTACVFAWEWGQVFIVHGIALHAPEALTALEATGGPTPFDLGVLIALLVFTLGWLAFAFSMVLTREYGRLAPTLVIAGFFALPLLGSVLPGAWGMVAGNVVLGAGWILLGRALIGHRRET
jgi:hypothetical protein